MKALREHFHDYGLVHLIITAPIIANVVCWAATGYTLAHFIN